MNGNNAILSYSIASGNIFFKFYAKYPINDGWFGCGFNSNDINTGTFSPFITYVYLISDSKTLSSLDSAISL